MLKVVGLPQTRTRRVIWALEELGLDYEIDPQTPRAEEVVRLTGAGKIPVLLDGDTTITDSCAILHYLTDKHGALTHPPGTPARAHQDALTFRILDEIEGPLWMLSKHKFVHPEDRRVPEVADSLRWEVGQGIERLGETLGDNPYLTGETLTVPDIIAGHLIDWAKRADVAFAASVIDAYQERLFARPAAAKAYAL